MKILVIDNYDSFTYNLVHFLGELGAKLEVFRNDKISPDEVMEKTPDAIVISPGPSTPDTAGICLELVRRAGADIPILGVCLGHQCIGQIYGGKVVRAPYLMHGKLSTIKNNGKSVFNGLPETFNATRYHSLIIERDTLPGCLEISALSEDGIIMGFAHREHPVHGVQFHPESIASEYGHRLLENFMIMARETAK